MQEKKVQNPLEIVDKLKQFNPDYYAHLLDEKAKGTLFKHQFTNAWIDFKAIALAYVAQSIHRLGYAQLIDLIQKKDGFNCQEISTIVTCMQQLTKKECGEMYFEYLRDNAPVIESLGNYFNLFNLAIADDLEQMSKSDNQQTKIIKM